MLIILTIGHKNKDHRSKYFDNLNILRIEENLLLRKVYKMKIKNNFDSKILATDIDCPCQF